MTAHTKTKSEVATVDQMRNALTPMDRVVASGAPPEVWASVMELQERWERNEARKAFDVAMAMAQAEMPVIFKDREVSFGQGKTSYRHASLSGIERTVKPVLAKHGLHYRFNTEFKTESNRLAVTCIVAHRDGHSETNTLPAPLDKSGSKNDIQSIGSTQTYLQRYTLMAALGLSSSDDDDGKSTGAAETITDEQVQEISDLLTKTKSDLVRFLKKIQLESLTEIRADKFDEIVKLINDTAAKRAAVAKEPA